MPFSIDAVTRSLNVFWQANFSGLPVVSDAPYDEEADFDMASASEWVTFWIDDMREEPVRRTGLQTIPLDVTVDIWVRRKGMLNLYRLEEIIDSAVACLDQQEVPVYDYEDSGIPLVGYIRLQEAQATDYSRQHENSVPGSARHARVAVRGVAMELHSS